MIVSNYENDIVFARFLIYIKKALTNKKIDYRLKQTNYYKFEVLMANEDFEFLSDTSVRYDIFDKSDILNLSSNVNYITKLDLALKKLSKKQQMVIDYYYYYDMSNKKIAEKMGITENAIEKLKIRALKKLRRIFSEEIKNEKED